MDNKGFTLVELLAVVVILSLLALLTSTAVTKLVKDAKSDLSNTQIKLIEEATKTWSADNIDDLPAAGECIYLTLEDLNNYGLINSNVTDPNTTEKLPQDLKIKMTTTTSDYGKIVTNYEVDSKNTNGCSYFYDPVCTYIDEDSSGTINLSDTITCGTESFHVMSNDGKKITMLTKYNLNVGDYAFYGGKLGIQNENVRGFKNGGVIFSDTVYWASTTNEYPAYVYNENSNLYQYVNAYEIYLNKLGVFGVKAALMSLEQLDELNCSANYIYCDMDDEDCYNSGEWPCSMAPSWVYSTEYWLGFAFSGSNRLMNMWALGIDGYIRRAAHNGGFYALTDEEPWYGGFYGVRPVITMPIYNIKEKN